MLWPAQPTDYGIYPGPEARALVTPNGFALAADTPPFSAIITSPGMRCKDRSMTVTTSRRSIATASPLSHR